MNILITGGAGFIGANFVNYWHKQHPGDKITVLDKLTYAGNLENLAAVKDAINFIHGDIADADVVETAIAGQDVVIHFAAETHVDRSIHDPFVFTKTNVLGTHTLLEAARKHNIKRFHHVSTDEVFGQIELHEQRKFNEYTSYDPSSPYSASKAGSDHMVRAYHKTYGLPITISNCGNNFGPYMHPEKFFARSIIRLLTGKNIPIYTPGDQIRDWLHVLDHCRAIEAILLNGKIGETYTIGGMTHEISNLEAAKTITRIMGLPESRIELVTDRPGHDAKYAVDWTKINRELGWKPEHTFEEWLTETIEWYKTHEAWWRPMLEETENFYKARGEMVLENQTTAQASTSIPAPLPMTAPSPIPTQQSTSTVPAGTPAHPSVSENDYIIETAIPGVMIIERPVLTDDRGFFRELFRKKHVEDRIGMKLDFVQANHSHSSKGTLRGIHISPWHKLISVTSGEIQAVVVDTRPYSPTFGKHVSIVLSAKSPRSIFVPQGCGNSFLVLSETADCTYLVTDHWFPGSEKGVNYADPMLNISWLNNEPSLSDKDKVNPTLSEVFPEQFTNPISKTMDKILIIGKNGNLGRELMKALQGSNMESDVVGWDRSDLDITNALEVEKKISELQPTIVFNCTAYTNVDGAETDYAAAELTNGLAVGYLARVCAKIGATLIHYSTGMVFSGENPNGYNEDSTPDPVNSYGKSKLAGEKAIQSSGANHYLIRTAWLYAKPENETSKKSFNEIMMDAAKANPQLKGVDDEIGSPTWAKDLAIASMDLINQKHPFGIYHITNSGQASRLDWTKEIFKIKDITNPVEAVSGNAFPRPAKRSHYELLTNTKLKPLRSWQEALKDYLNSN